MKNKKFPGVKSIYVLAFFFLSLICTAQAPGGVLTGLTAWFKADGLTSGNVAGWTTSGGSLNITLSDPAAPYPQSTNGNLAGGNLYNYNQYVSFAGNVNNGNLKVLTNSGAFNLGTNGSTATDQSSFFTVFSNNPTAGTNNDNVVIWRIGADGANASGIQCRGLGSGRVSIGRPWQNGIASDAYGTRMFNSPNMYIQQIGAYTGNCSSATSMTGYFNNTVVGSGSSGVQTSQQLSFGGRSNGSELFQGNEAENIFYNVTLPATDVTKVNTYLAIKYGITLTTNYVSPTNTTIFVTSAPYNKNIIGIGRDDASALIQRQSHNIDDSVRVYKGTLSTTNATNAGVFGTNDSYVVIGADLGLLKSTATANLEVPIVSPAINSRLEREWKVTNTHYSLETFNMDIKLSGGFPCYSSPADLRLLVDDDGNFTNAMVYAAGGGLSFSLSGSLLTITGISNMHIPLNGTKYITVATVKNTVPTVTISSSPNSICAGTPVSFTASSTFGGTAPNYQWQVNGANAGTGTTFSSSSLNNGDQVSVILTSNDACVITNTASSNAITVTVSNPVTPAVGVSLSSPAICPGTNVTFTATPTNGGTSPSYQWQVNGTNAGTNSPNYNSSTLNNGDVITVILTSNQGCVTSATATAQASVTVYPLPTPTITSNSPVCAGQSLNFAGSGGVNYSWSGPLNFNSVTQNPSIPSCSVNNTGTYTLTVTDANNCQKSITTSVTVNALPVVSAIGATICANQTLNLSASGGSTYSWSGPNTFTSSVQNPSLSNASSSMNGVYTVTVTDINNCVNTGTATALINPVPSLTVSNTGPVCQNQSFSLTATGGSLYFWVGPGFSSALQSPVISNASTANSGIYTVVATVGTCTGSATTSVTVFPLPAPNIASNSPICIGQSLNLSGNGGTAYSWSGPLSFNSVLQNDSIPSCSLSNAGTYTLTVTDANNCQNNTTTFVTVNALPVVSAFGATVCANQTLNFSAYGGTSYSWSGPNNFTSSLQNPALSNASSLMNGIYTVTVTDVNSCVNTANATAVINPIPTPTVTNNGPVCQNETLILAAAGGLYFTWTGPNGFMSTDQSPIISPAYTNMTGTYMVTVTDAIGCAGTATTAVMVNALPVATITSGANTGCAPLCVTFTVQGNSLQSNVWNFGTGVSGNGLSAQQCYNSSGVYTISATYTDANNCGNVSTYTVESYPMPVADYNWAPIKPIINSDDVDFTDASYGANIISWNWYFMNLPNATSTLQNPSYYYDEAGIYPAVLVVRSDKGCFDTIIKNIVVEEDFSLYVPNAFTPNGDGRNDIFQAKGIGIVKYEFMIFDRWGELLFRTETFEEGWDGKKQIKNDINYAVCPSDIYVWKIRATDMSGKAHEYTGHVTLMK